MTSIPVCFLVFTGCHTAVAYLGKGLDENTGLVEPELPALLLPEEMPHRLPGKVRP